MGRHSTDRDQSPPTGGDTHATSPTAAGPGEPTAAHSFNDKDAASSPQPHHGTTSNSDDLPVEVEKKTPDYDETRGSDDETDSSRESTLGGVKAMEAMTMTWTKRGLIAAYCGIMVMAIANSLEGQVSISVAPFVTSSFSTHSLLSTVGVVQNVINSVAKPPIAKFADVFGRLEGFCLCVGIFTLGYVQMAASQNPQTYAAAQIFYSAGSTGLQTLEQIFIADTTDLSNRALFSSLPDTPFLVTTWIGSHIGVGIMNSSGSWRWAYGMWAIILPVAFLPLFISLFLNGRRAKKMGVAPTSKGILGGNFLNVLGNLWRELDVGGIILLSAGFSLVLIPCTIAGTTSGGWSNPEIISMVTIGAILLIIFPFWEISTRFARKRGVTGGLRRITENTAPYPIVPLHLFKSRTFAAGMAVAFFYFMAFYLSVQPYFYSYLLVVRALSVPTAAYIQNIFSLSSSVSSVLVGLCIKFSNRYKWWMTAGACLYMLGMGLMTKYRTDDAPLSAIIGTQILIGFAGGMLNVPAQLGVQTSAGHQNVGTATAMFLTMISVGGAVGSAISGAVWGRLIPAKLNEYLPAEFKDQAGAIYGDIEIPRGYDVGSPERLAVNRAYQETMTTLLTICVCVCAPIIIGCVLMSNYHLDEVEQGVKGRVIGGDVDERGRKVDTGAFQWYNPVHWFTRRGARGNRGAVTEE